MNNVGLKIVMFLLLLSTGIFAKANKWVVYDHMPIPVAGAEAITFDNKIFILGGYSQKTREPIGNIQMFDPLAPPGERWQDAGKMLIPRSNFAARMYNETVYIVGGQTGPEEKDVDQMETWRFGSAIDEPLANLRLNRIGSAAEIWKEYLIIIGGYDTDAAQLLPDDGDDEDGYLIIYNLAAKAVVGSVKAFDELEPYNQASVLLGDTLFVFGGVRSGISDRIYRFDLSLIDWAKNPLNFPETPPRVFPDLLTPRSAMEAVVTDPNTAWLIGGHNEGKDAMDSVDIFTVTSTGYEHTNGPTLNVARKEAIAAMVDTVIYVFGGVNSSGGIEPSVEALLDKYSDSTEVMVHDRSTAVSFKLEQNYPNPFNATTTFEFELTTASEITLAIYAADGRLINTLVRQTLAAGTFRHLWNGAAYDGSPVPSGIYFYKLTTSTESLTRKMLLVK